MTEQEFPTKLFETIQQEASDLAKALDKVNIAHIDVAAWQTLLIGHSINEEIAAARKVVEYLTNKLDKTKEGVQLAAKRGAEEDLATVARHLEEKLREDVRTYAYIMGDKPDVPGVTVRSKPVFTYKVVEAVEYCKEHVPSLLMVNKKKFEKLLAATPEVEVPWVERAVTYTPIITTGKLEILPEPAAEPILPTKEDSIPF